MESLGEDKASTPLYRYHLPFAVTPHHSQIGIIFTHISLTNGGESNKGLSKVSVFGDSCQRGRNIKPKTKGPDHQTSKFFEMIIYVCLFNWYLMIEISSIDMIFSTGIFKDRISKLVSKYKFQLISIKTLLKTKRRILFRGSFV
jgi:hypothetical protein